MEIKDDPVSLAVREIQEILDRYNVEFHSDDLEDDSEISVRLREPSFRIVS